MQAAIESSFVLGRSRVEEDKLALARTLLQKASSRNITIHLPIDVVVARTESLPCASSAFSVIVTGLSVLTASVPVSWATAEKDPASSIAPKGSKVAGLAAKGVGEGKGRVVGIALSTFNEKNLLAMSPTGSAVLDVAC